MPDVLAPLAQELARRAAAFGHDVEALERGEEVVTHTTVATIAELRGLSMATAEQRRRRQAVFFHPAIAVRRVLGQGIHDRMEAYVVADGSLDPLDVERASAHFPFPVRVLSVLRKDVPAGEIWDLSVRGDHWGLDDRDDILSVVNVGELRIGPDAAVIVRGNLLMLVIGRLVCERGGGDPPQLAVLPTPFSVDRWQGALHGGGGAAGSDGAAGAVAVKASGGQVVAQDEQSSEYFGMPSAAIARGAVDQVLALDRIAPAVVEFARPCLS
jgi:hypothetical protein